MARKLAVKRRLRATRHRVKAAQKPPVKQVEHEPRQLKPASPKKKTRRPVPRLVPGPVRIRPRLRKVNRRLAKPLMKRPRKPVVTHPVKGQQIPVRKPPILVVKQHPALMPAAAMPPAKTPRLTAKPMRVQKLAPLLVKRPGILLAKPPQAMARRMRTRPAKAMLKPGLG